MKIIKDKQKLNSRLYLIEGIVIILLGLIYLIGGIVTDKIMHSVLAICLIVLGISYLKRR